MTEELDEINEVLLQNLGTHGIEYTINLMASLIENGSTQLNCPESLLALCMWKILTPSLFNFQETGECETGLLMVMLKEIYRSIKDEDLKNEIDKCKHGLF